MPERLAPGHVAAMRLDKRTLAFVAVAAVLAAVFVQLGFWQLGRAGQREAADERREARLDRPALRTEEAAALAPDSLSWRRVRLRGTYDYDREMVVRGRSHRGRPGVEVLTPLLPAGGGRAVLVLRGWLPSADAVHADLEEGRPPPGARDDRVAVEGVALASRAAADSARRVEMEGRAVPVLAAADPAAAARALPYPVAPYVVRATDPGPAGPALEPRADPAPESSPHVAYAIQWFCFAAIAAGGAAAYALRRGRA